MLAGVAGTPAHGGDVAVDSWATEITTKWRAVISQQKAAAGAASLGGTPLQSPRGKPPPGGLGSDAPLAPTVSAGRWIARFLPLLGGACHKLAS